MKKLLILFVSLFLFFNIFATNIVVNEEISIHKIINVNCTDGIIIATIDNHQYIIATAIIKGRRIITSITHKVNCQTCLNNRMINQ